MSTYHFGAIAPERAMDSLASQRISSRFSRQQTSKFHFADGEAREGALSVLRSRITELEVKLAAFSRQSQTVPASDVVRLREDLKAQRKAASVLEEQTLPQGFGPLPFQYEQSAGAIALGAPSAGSRVF